MKDVSTIEEADETDEDEEIENQTENVELEMIDMRSLLAIRIYYAAKYGLKSVKKAPIMCSIILQITKAPIAKIWHVLKAKAIAALEKYASVSTFEEDCPVFCTRPVNVQINSLFYVKKVKQVY